MKMIIKHIIALALTTSVIQAYAQGQIGTANVDLTVQGNTQLGQATRTFEKNNESAPQPNQKALSYDYKEVQLNLPKLTSKIKVPKLKTPTLAELRSNYVKAGFGNYTAPYLEAYFASKRSEKYLYGAHLKHLSYKNGPVRYSGSSENLIDLYGKYFGKSVVVDGEIGYQRLGYNYYGYNESISIDKDSIRQAYQVFRGKLGLTGINKGPFSWRADAQAFMFSDKFNISENEYQGNLYLGYKINDKISIEFNNNLSVSDYKQDSVSTNRIWYNASPLVHYYKDKLHVKVGFNIAYANDTLSGSSGTRVYPVAFGEYTLIEKKLKAFASIDGSLDKNLIRTYTAQNPWVGQNVYLASTNRRLSLQAGLGGKALPFLQWEAKLGYTSYTNMYFFNNSAQDSAKFDVLYDSLHTNLTSLGFELKYDQGKAFKGGVRGEYTNYKTQGLEKPWHKPAFQGLVYASYNIGKKMYFDANLYYISGIQGKNAITGEVVSLKPITDLSFKAEYRVSDRISGFLTFNNLLSQKYQRYLYYQSRGLNVMAGVTVIF